MWPYSVMNPLWWNFKGMDVDSHFNLLKPELPFRNVQYIIRFENLDYNFRELCNLIGLPYKKLPIFNKSKHEHYSKYYDNELIELVHKKFKDEIDFFGYKFESII